MGELEGEKVVKALKALANQVRLRMIASLCEGPKNIYTLAKELDLPYPLAHLHLSYLKRLGLVKEVEEKKRSGGLPTVKYYVPSDFKLVLTPKSIQELFRKERR